MHKALVLEMQYHKEELQLEMEFQMHNQPVVMPKALV